MKGDKDIADPIVVITFDGWTATYDYEAVLTSDDLHPIGYCEKVGHKLESPKGFLGVFDWSAYLEDNEADAVPALALSHECNVHFHVYAPCSSTVGGGASASIIGEESIQRCEDKCALLLRMVPCLKAKSGAIVDNSVHPSSNLVLEAANPVVLLHLWYFLQSNLEVGLISLCLQYGHTLIKNRRIGMDVLEKVLGAKMVNAPILYDATWLGGSLLANRAPMSGLTACGTQINRLADQYHRLLGQLLALAHQHSSNRRFQVLTLQAWQGGFDETDLGFVEDQRVVDQVIQLLAAFDNVGSSDPSVGGGISDTVQCGEICWVDVTKSANVELSGQKDQIDKLTDDNSDTYFDVTVGQIPFKCSRLSAVAIFIDPAGMPGRAVDVSLHNGTTSTPAVTKQSVSKDFRGWIYLDGSGARRTNGVSPPSAVQPGASVGGDHIDASAMDLDASNKWVIGFDVDKSGKHPKIRVNQIRMFGKQQTKQLTALDENILVAEELSATVLKVFRDLQRLLFRDITTTIPFDCRERKPLSEENLGALIRLRTKFVKFLATSAVQAVASDYKDLCQTIVVKTQEAIAATPTVHCTAAEEDRGTKLELLQLLVEITATEQGLDVFKRWTSCLEDLFTCVRSGDVASRRLARQLLQRVLPTMSPDDAKNGVMNSPSPLISDGVVAHVLLALAQGVCLRFGVAATDTLSTAVAADATYPRFGPEDMAEWLAFAQRLYDGTYGDTWRSILRKNVQVIISGFATSANSAKADPTDVRIVSSALCLVDRAFVDAMEESARAHVKLDSKYCANHDDGETAATVLCAQCQIALCDHCDQVLHYPKAKHVHVRSSIAESKSAVSVVLEEDNTVVTVSTEVASLCVNKSNFETVFAQRSSTV